MIVPLFSLVKAKGQWRIFVNEMRNVSLEIWDDTQRSKGRQD